MNQIRHFFRYEIPGYLSFIYVFIIVVSILEKSYIVAYIIPNIHSIALAGFLIAIPVGWIIYQVYDKFRFKGFHCHPNTLEKVKSWFSNDDLEKYIEREFIKFNQRDKKKAVLSDNTKTKMKDKMKEKLKNKYYQQAIDIGIYTKKKCPSYHFELLINNLSKKFNSYDSRYIIGIIGYVPQIFMIALMIFFKSSMHLKYNFFDFNITRLLFISIFTLIVTAISVIISSHKRNIYNAIQAQEDFLISIKKNEIENALKILWDKDKKE